MVSAPSRSSHGPVSSIPWGSSSVDKGVEMADAVRALALVVWVAAAWVRTL